MIEFSHVSKNYGAGSRAVKDLNLTIRDGEFVFVVGRSGSGKSTLIKMLLRGTRFRTQCHGAPGRFRCAWREHPPP